MRFGIIRTALLGSFLAIAAFGQQQLTVDRLVTFITSSINQKMQDKEVAQFLAGVRMTERLDARTIESLQGKGAGPKTVMALNKLAEMSASLTPPVVKAAPPKPKLPDPPSYEEQFKVLADVREYALNYTKTLPDFICLEVTRRYYDRHYKPGTEGSWAIADRLSEKLTYFDQKEKYELLSQNDNSLYGKSTESVGGALSRGDFGTLLKDIFEPDSSADFHWERWGNLGGHLMHVYTYAIDQPHSKETISYQGQQQSTPGYHGEIFVEKGSNVIWRVTVEPEPPPSFPVQNVHQVLDYRYVDIGGQQFLLPQSGEVIMRADGVGTKNDIEFRTYRKYSADTSITFDDKDADTPPGAEETKPETKPEQKP